MTRGYLAVLAALVAGTTPAGAGTLYVPYAAAQEIQGAEYSTRVRVHNDSEATAALTYLFVPAGTSSVDFDRETLPISVAVAPHSTATFADWVPDGQLGWLEIQAPAEVSVTARLVGTAADGVKTFGTEIPVVVPETVVPAGQTTILQGLASAAGEKATHLVLLNLEPELNTCVAEVFRSTGARVLTQNVVQPGLIATSFKDVLGLIGLVNANDVSIALTCDRKSYAFGLVQQLESAQALAVSPAGRGSSTPVASGCSAEAAVCYQKHGIFFTPAPQADYLRVNIPVPKGSYSSLHLRVQVTNGGWTEPTDGLNQMFWMARNGKNLDLFGFMAFRGPDRNAILLRHGIGQLPKEKAKLSAGFVAEVGETYVLDYVYDPVEELIRFTIRDTSESVLLSVTDTPNVNRVHIDDDGDFIAVDFSFKNGVRDEEPPSYDWDYSNLLLELFD